MPSHPLVLQPIQRFRNLKKNLQQVFSILALIGLVLAGSFVSAQVPPSRSGEGATGPASQDDDAANNDESSNSKAVDQDKKPKRPILVNHDPVAIAANELAPEWVRKGTYEENGVQYVVVQTDGMNTPHDAFEAISPAMQKAANQQIDAWLGKPGASQRIQLSTDFLRENLVVSVPPAAGQKPAPRYEVHEFKSKYSPEFAKQLGREYGDFFCGYAQLRFDEEFKAHVLKEWDQILTQNRLLLTACIGVGFFSLLAVLFGYLRLNHMTRGFYTGRLQTVSAVVAVIVVIICILAANYLQLL